MERIAEKAHQEIKDPEVFFDTVDEILKDRKTLSRDDLQELKDKESGNARVNAVAEVLSERFDDIKNMAVAPKEIDSTYGDYHDELFARKFSVPDVLSEREFSVLKNVMDHDKETSYLNWATYGRVAKRSAQTLAAGALTVGCGALTGATWELPTVLIGAFCTIEAGRATYRNGVDLFQPASTMLKKEFEQRQNVVDKWQFFNRKAVY